MSLFALSLQFLVGMVVTILTDIIHFGIYYPLSDLVAERGRDVFRFSAGMAILNLLIKPASCFFVYQMYRERGGDYNVNFGKCVQMSWGQKLEGVCRLFGDFLQKKHVNMNILLSSSGLESIPSKLNKYDLIFFGAADDTEEKSSFEQHNLWGHFRTCGKRSKSFFSPQTTKINP